MKKRHSEQRDKTIEFSLTVRKDAFFLEREDAGARSNDIVTRQK